MAAAPESAPESAELESYKQVLSGYIIRNAIYPLSASALRQEGIVFVAVVFGRDGTVLSHHLVRSSGVAALDDEALDIFARSGEFPAVPSDLPAPLSLVVPFRFYLR
jgi:periplasmic protein TonB